MMKLGFLVYDSRSGSTLLARLLSERLAGVVVTQEIGFENLLKAAAARGGVVSAEIARRALRRDYLRNLGLPTDWLERRLQQMGHAVNVSELLRWVVSEHVASVHRAENATHALIKYGRHVACWPAIQQVLGNDAPLLHLVRDPRAVISSKLTTARPYYPFETFAWGGSLLAAYRWRAFCHAAERAAAAGLNVREVRYESLLGDPEGTLEHLRTWLGVENSQAATVYRIPEAEEGIHQLAHRQRLETTRTVAWRAQLSDVDLRRIEALTGLAMIRRGYLLDTDQRAWSTMCTLAAAASKTAALIARHYVQHAWHRAAIATKDDGAPTQRIGGARAAQSAGRRAG